MCAAAAKIAGKRGADVAVGWIRVLLQQRLRLHHHAGNAIAALRRLLLDEGALDGTWIFNSAESFKRCDPPAFEQQQRGDAGVDGLAVHHYGAGAALAETAAELRAVERQ